MAPPFISTAIPSSHPNNGNAKSLNKLLRKSAKTLMRSHRFKIPKYDLPIRLRPWFLVLTTLVMIILAFLGFTNFAHALPLNDKILHFVCFMLATGVFYFIFDVEEEARRIWFWRHANMLLTGFICFFCGGIMSEFVQSMLPYKEFQFGDVVANLMGSSVGLYVAYHLEKYYRYRREIARLYRPIETDYSSDDSEDEDSFSMTAQLLPLHTTTRPSSNTNTNNTNTHSNTSDPFSDPPNNTRDNRSSANNSRYIPSNTAKLREQRQRNGGKKKSVRFTDVWDAGEREELFAVGDAGESDEDDEDVPLAVRKGSLTTGGRDVNGRGSGTGRGEGGTVSGIGNGSGTDAVVAAQSQSHVDSRQDIPRIYVTDS
ncbi:hypothetical protein PC9H_007497 [Pleurotus ostreatus]|uniref:VanZ-like domain-containing protein n=1 Tax=Pleurotus ostreatus TaxID=5322 RepID=A0A8H6ZU16_PLEOS|nr:uncharacterized protein PC9H_007497 [Pleurotus ostreatus]KAF7428276.1 hypothetical protein PC9H_007497 [Pleurotus ostreatus]KAJ8696375.1 hypothetical protein PTI98_006249 [Pleurotus ostreatus]